MGSRGALNRTKLNYLISQIVHISDSLLDGHITYYDLYQVTTGELYKVTMHTAHISSNGSHFLTDGFLI